MKTKQLILLLLILSILISACGNTTTGPARNAEMVLVFADASTQNWLDDAAVIFNQNNIKTAEDKPIFVVVNYLDAGEAIDGIANLGYTPDLWIPDNQAWVDVLNAGGVASFGECLPTAESPLVIAMWQPIAETLGWPGREIGWLDIGSLAADPSAWAYYSGGQFGNSLRIGHTHPGLSASGSATLLAVVQAAQSQTEAVSVSEINQPIVQASVSAFESSVSFFSRDSAALAATMYERGSSYLGAAILYENQVLDLQNAGAEIVPIYPFEGTFVADHPACLTENPDAGASVAAAKQFRDFLLSDEGMAMAEEHGYQRPGSVVASGKPVFEMPNTETLFAVQDLWSAAKKPVNLVMVIDTSGSMQGDKMRNVRTAAVQFVEQMNDDDFITVLSYGNSSDVIMTVAQSRVGDMRFYITAAIQNLNADGETPLYDSIGYGATLLFEEGTAQTNNVLVVLTDGMDTSSQVWQYDQTFTDHLLKENISIYTIAYGNNANETVLEEIALSGNGNYYQGGTASIAAIYEEISILFGGNVGLGR